MDGCLAYYDGWKGLEHVGEPIPAMVEIVKRMLSRGYEVRIFTARASHTGRKPEEVDQAVAVVQDWCERHLGARLAVTAEKDFGMIALYDDRAFRVEENTGRILGVS